MNITFKRDKSQYSNYSMVQKAEKKIFLKFKLLNKIMMYLEVFIYLGQMFVSLISIEDF